MSDSYPLCYICNQKPSSTACICFKSLQYLCNYCLVSHIKDNTSCHFVLSLSLAASVNPNLSDYLELPIHYTKPSSISKPRRTKSKPLSINPQDQISPLSLPYSAGKSLVSDLFISLSTPGSLYQSETSNYLCGLAYGNSSQLLIYDIISKNVILAPIPITCRDARVYNISPRDLILVLFSSRNSSKLYIYYMNVNSRRLNYLSKFDGNWITDKFIYNNSALYSFYKARMFKIDFNRGVSINIRSKYEEETQFSTVNIGKSIYLFQPSAKKCHIINTETHKEQQAPLNRNKVIGNIQFVCTYGVNFLLLTKNYTYICDPSLNMLCKVPRKYPVKIDDIGQSCILGNEVYYYNTATLIAEKFRLFCDSTIKELCQDSYDENETRYLILKKSAYEWCRIDCKYKIQVPIKFPFKRLYHLCELPGEYFIQASFRWILYRPSSNQSIEIHGNWVPIMISLVYCNRYVYGFSKDSIWECDIDYGSWSVKLERIETINRKFPCCVAVGSKIFIIGGGIMTVNMYDVESNSYSKVGRVLSRNAVAKVVGDIIYVICERGYQIYDREFRLLETGMSEVPYGVEMGNKVGYYDGRLYFYNNSIRALEYLDLKSYERKVEILEYINK
jgi:hypothetical protein